MLKMIFSTQFREDVGAEEGLRHWLEDHARIVRTVPGVVRFVQNVPSETLAPGFDGIAELWFRDREAYEAAQASPEWQAANEDAAEFMNLETVGVAIVDEVELAPEGLPA